jgi:hypothetical protein
VVRAIAPAKPLGACDHDDFEMKGGLLHMPRAFVVKTVSRDVPTYVIPGVFASLKTGKARIGWSYQDDLDLRVLREKVVAGQWDDLSKAEQDAWACHRFLDDVSTGDYLVYPHQEQYGKLCIALVTGDYQYSGDDDSLNGDFRSLRPCRLLTTSPVDRYDEIVPPLIRRKIGLQGRFYELYDVELLMSLIENLPRAGKAAAGGAAPRVKRVFGSFADRASKLIGTEFPAHDFSRIFLRELLEAMGYAVKVQEGPTEYGADLIVTIGDDFLPREFTVGIQAFCYEGEISRESLLVKLNQLKEGWCKNQLNYGALVTTGFCGQAGEKLIEEHNKQNPERRVRLIDGKRLAGLFFRHFEPPQDIP